MAWGRLNRENKPTAPPNRNMGDLAVLVPFFNPCGYSTLIKNAEKCVGRLVNQGAKHIYFIEILYQGDAKALVTNSISPKLPNECTRIYVPSQSIMFAKEAIFNIGLSSVSEECTKVLFLDADIFFEQNNWMSVISSDLDDLDVLQPFTLAKYLRKDMSEDISKEGWAYSFVDDQNSEKVTQFKSHCGFGLAAKKSYLKKVGGLFDGAFGGSGDELNLRIITGLPVLEVKSSEYIKSSLTEYLKKQREQGKLRFGYSTLTVNHLFHGDLKNRSYINRHKLFSDFGLSSESLVLGSRTEFREEVRIKANKIMFDYFSSRDDDSLKKSSVSIDLSCIPELRSETHDDCNSNSAPSQKSNQNSSVSPGIQSRCWISFINAICGYSAPDRPISHNDMLIDVRTGLFNRLRVLVTCLWISKQVTNCKVYCHWPINDECSVSLESFYLCIDPILLVTLDKATYIAQRLPQSNIFGEFNSSCRAPGPLTVIRAAKLKAPEDFSVLYKDFKFMPKIYSKYAKKIRNMPPRPWIGLHIRRTDAYNLSKKLEKELPSMEQYLDFVKASAKGELFHCILCTDDSDVIQLMKFRLGDHRVTVLSDPTKMKTIRTNYGARPDAGREIILDAMILSSCDYFLGTSCSSISETVELWKKSKIRHEA